MSKEIEEESKEYHNGRKEGAKQAAEDIKMILFDDINKGINLRNLEITKMNHEIDVLIDMRSRVADVRY